MLSVERLLVIIFAGLLWINDNMMTTFANNFSHITKNVRKQHFIEAFVHDVEKYFNESLRE